MKGTAEKNKQKVLFFAITALGISSIITQLLVVREFLGAFYGNELVFGIILGNWLLLTGIGSFLGKHLDRIKGKFRFLIIAQILIAVLPFVHIFLIRALRNVLFLTGQLVGITKIFLFSLLLLLPYCLISGSLLTLACVLFSRKKDPHQIGWVYFIDNIGDILGGLLFSFLLIYFLNPFQIVLVLLIINLAAAISVAVFRKRNLLAALVAGLLIFSLLGFALTDLNTLSTQLLFRGQNLVFQETSKYGKLVVTESGDQYNFYQNAQPLFTTMNTISNEETVHYAMVQHDQPEKVLVIGGGAAGTIDEILKYNVSRIDYVELDPLITRTGKRFGTLPESPELNTINMDGRLFVKRTNQDYDAVIVDLPDPNSAQINRFYTVNFFREVKNILDEGGVVSVSLTSSENYLSPEAIRLNSALYQTLHQVFAQVIVIPGDHHFFLASDKELSYDIAGLIDQKDIPTQYVNQNYLQGKLTPERINYVLNSLKEKVQVNTDFHPVTYFYYFQYWMSHFQSGFGWLLLFIAFLLVMVLLKVKPVSFSIFTTGFAAASLEVVLLIGFQILYGYAYHQVGIIVTSFMIGLAAGAYLMNKKLSRMKLKNLVRIEFVVAGYSLVLPLILLLISQFQHQLVVFLSTQVLFPLLTIIIAALVGAEFPLASKLHLKRKRIAHTAGTLYGADFLGACIGSLIVSALLIPLVGLFWVCIIMAALNLVSGLVVSRL